MSAPSAKLFSPLSLSGPKGIELKHRVVMAPLTRCRAVVGEGEHTPNGAVYYKQRASEGGLIVAEATQITPQGQGYPGTPGIYSKAQIESWKNITSAVHEKNGVIFLQLWHVGRVRAEDSVSSSDIPLKQVKCTNLKTMQQVDAEAPKSLTVEEIANIVELYGVAAKNAIEAGFDGVEIHGANGYLVDQFLQSGVNQRTDSYGGSIENRLRFLKEVVESVLKHVGDSSRVGIRISPSGTIHEMSDSNPTELFTEVAKLLNNYNLAYLHVIEPRSSLMLSKSVEEVEAIVPVACKQLRQYFKGAIIAAGGFNRKTAIDIVESGDADLVAFGRHFISNPDLPKRLEEDLPLNAYNRDTFYYSSDLVTGYTDYPAHE